MARGDGRTPLAEHVQGDRGGLGRAGAGEEDEGEDDMDDMADLPSLTALASGGSWRQGHDLPKGVLLPILPQEPRVYPRLGARSAEGWAFFRDETTFSWGSSSWKFPSRWRGR